MYHVVVWHDGPDREDVAVEPTVAPPLGLQVRGLELHCRRLTVAPASSPPSTHPNELETRDSGWDPSDEYLSRSGEPDLTPSALWWRDGQASPWSPDACHPTSQSPQSSAACHPTS